MSKPKDQGKFDIALKDAKEGQVVTRFPPEPSGYLHIGHAKAALLNQYFANFYNGKLIVRFDDTNPSKEKQEFEDSILLDIKLLGIEPDIITHTSDYFEKMYELAVSLIKKGLAYVDDTEQETVLNRIKKMRDERMKGIKSKNRDLSTEQNLELFEEMRIGSEKGLKNCLRAKMSVDNKNKALRDPVIYRCNLEPHIRTKDKYKIYPTYDFACPIVDSIEGVTHALRTNEYRDRNDQYNWFLKNLELRKVHIWDFSRINFVYTLLSKRKLQKLVDMQTVDGWDDPRFPTVRGIRRRGLSIEALKQYILMQGASQNILTLEWDKLWNLNKKLIDSSSPRHVALEKENICLVKVLNAQEIGEPFQMIAKNKKNADLGCKKVFYSESFYIEYADAKDLLVDEEITLMDWGNAFVRKIAKTNESLTLEMDLNLSGDYKKTKKKITWLSSSNQTTECLLIDYDYLITKKKLEEEDELTQHLNPNSTIIKTCAIADHNTNDLKGGDVIQFERKGFYIVDDQLSATYNKKALIYIPDGKAKSLAPKHLQQQDNSKENKPKGNKESSKKPKKKLALPKMYTSESFYGTGTFIPSQENSTKMYSSESFYEAQ